MNLYQRGPKSVKLDNRERMQMKEKKMVSQCQCGTKHRGRHVFSLLH
jgi:hypothetical protein